MTSRISNRLRRLNAWYFPQHVVHSPKWLVLGVNNTCNLHCKMCDVGVNFTQSNFFNNLMGSRPVHMPLDLFKKIADQAAHYFPSVKLGYAFTEPLIYTHLEESLHYAKHHKLFTSITTNGLGLKKWAPVLHETNLKEINISLDGPPELHNYIRGNEHSFSKAIEGIEALVSISNTITINVFCVITEWNAGRLEAFLQIMNNYPLSRVGFMHSNFTSPDMEFRHNKSFGDHYPATCSNVTETNSESIDTRQLWNEIQKIKKRSWNFPVTFHPEIPSSEVLHTYYFHPEIFIGKQCMDIFSDMMIKSNGDVIPAHGRCYNLKIGNIYSQNLKEIWNSATIAQFRKTVTKNGGLLPACSRCCSSFVK